MSKEEHHHSHDEQVVSKGFPLPASKEPLDKIKVLKIILAALSCLTLGIGVYFTLVMYFPLGGISTALSMGVAQFCGFLMILYLLATLLLLKLIPRASKSTPNSQDELTLKRTSKKREIPARKIVVVVGLSLFFINSLPLLMTPVAIQTAENEFEDAYGENWGDNIPAHINSFFMASQFNLYNYFVGFPHADCNVDRNIVYHTIDADTYFMFDVYYPKATTRELPGHNSTIIKIHGGGWTTGDKSEMNTLWINKYLAAQGYIVFDIQYGLLNTSENMGLPTPEHVLGDFKLTDMVEHIGIFTYLLETNFSSIYQADLNSVFIMGGSAGGHLTAVVGLGYNDPYFQGNFSNALTLKGIVPMYPVNDAEHVASGGRASLIDGTPESNPLAFEKFSPSNLVDANDPDALFFQGTHDWLVPPSNAQAIESALEAVGLNGILLMFPFAGHAHDYLTNNNFAQVWVYYLERFLYLQQIY